MPFVSQGHRQHHGKAVGNGHCVALVREACGAPHTSQWRRGAKVRGHPDLAPGTAIATFDPNGRYGNHTDGRSHAAILLEITDAGLRVCDQWVGRTTHERTIRYRNGSGQAVNDGDQYYVIEPASA